VAVATNAENSDFATRPVTSYLGRAFLLGAFKAAESRSQNTETRSNACVELCSMNQGN
jgi:hypothetical protein